MYQRCRATQKLYSLSLNALFTFSVYYVQPMLGNIGCVEAESMACAWWYYGCKTCEGLVSCGSLRDLGDRQGPIAFKLPAGYYPKDIVAVTWVNSEEMACAWYNNGNVSCGRTYDLDSERAPYDYSLPQGYEPRDIVDIAWVDSEEMACAWYDDGKVSWSHLRPG